MLENDVADNKAIGSHGAIFLRKISEGLDKLCVLTHCNTGRYVPQKYIYEVAYWIRVLNLTLILVTVWQQLAMELHLV